MVNKKEILSVNIEFTGLIWKNEKFNCRFNEVEMYNIEYFLYLDEVKIRRGRNGNYVQIFNIYDKYFLDIYNNKIYYISNSNKINLIQEIYNINPGDKLLDIKTQNKYIFNVDGTFKSHKDSSDLNIISKEESIILENEDTSKESYLPITTFKEKLIQYLKALNIEEDEETDSERLQCVICLVNEKRIRK